MPRRQSKCGVTLIELLVVLAVIGVLVAILLPAVQAAREAARRIACKNNLKQLALGLHLYHDTHHGLPPGDVWVNDDVGPGWSWGARLLPYLELSALHDMIDFQQHVYGIPGMGDRHRQVVANVLPGFDCPSESGPRQLPVPFLSPYIQHLPTAGPGPSPHTLLSLLMGTSNYAGVKEVGVPPLMDSGILFRNSGIRFQDIVDGQSNTFAIGEVRVGSLPDASFWAGTPASWMSGCQGVTRLRLNEAALPGDARRAFGSWHPGGAQFAMCDGSVRFIHGTIDSADPSRVPYVPGVYQALSTRAGSEVVDF